MAEKSYKVTGPLATPYTQSGARVYLYENAAWPSGLREGETERFLDLELIGEVSESEDEKPAKKAAASKSSN